MPAAARRPSRSRHRRYRPRRRTSRCPPAAAHLVRVEVSVRARARARARVRCRVRVRVRVRVRRTEQPVAVHDDLVACALVGLRGDALDRAGQAETRVDVQYRAGLRGGEQALLLGDHGRHDAVDRDGLAWLG